MVMAAIRQRIAGRSLTPGARLPSIRKSAAALKVSPSTVVEAYERLVAEGAIHSRPGAGFYVVRQTAPLSLSEIGPKVDRAVDPFWVSRQSLESSDGVLKPGCGWLPPSWLPEDGIRRALRSLSRADGAVLVDYGSPLGLSALRQFLARRMAGQGIECSPDQIMLTESGTQAMDLLCRFLLEPGDTVLVDDPCYFNFQALLRAHRAKIVSVPYTPSGPDIELFGQVLTRASSAALHHELRNSQSDRRDPIPRDGTQAAQARGSIRADDHRRRSFRRLRTRCLRRVSRLSTGSTGSSRSAASRRRFRRRCAAGSWPRARNGSKGSSI